MSSSWRRALYLLLVIGVFLGAWSYYFPDSAIGGVIVNKVNTYRLNQGLVGWWTFDGTDLTTTTASDRSGNGNYGTLSGASKPTPTGGKIGQALQFNGSPAYIDVQTVSGLPIYANSTAYSISMWVKGPANQIDKAVYGERNDGGNAEFEFGTDTSGTGKVVLWLKNNAGTVILNDVLSTGVAFDNSWHHITWVDNNGTAKLYIDGMQDATNYSYTRTGVFTLNRSRIGNLAGVSYFTGTIDDVRIYNRVLSASEVKLLYTSTAGSKMNTSKNVIPGSTLQTGLVGLWSFDGTDLDFRTNTAYDRSGQGNNGEMDSMSTSTSRVSGKVGQALQFDGVNDGVWAPLTGLTPATSGTAFSWAFWVKTRNPGTYNYVLGWSSYRDCLIGNFVFGHIACQADTSGGPVLSTTYVADGQWHHVVFTHTGSPQQKLYIDGVLEDTGSQSLNLANPNAGLAIGYVESNSSFDGSLDDVRVYNRALSAAEVKDLYTATVGTKVNHSQDTVPGSTLQQGLVGLWSFNGPDLDFRTNTAFDRSGQGNNGEMLNMSTSTSRTSGRVGQALRFDGVDDDIQISNFGATVSNVPFSWSFWYKEKPDGSADDMISLGYYRYCAADYGGSLRCTVGGDGYNGPSVSNNIVMDGAWHHIAYVYTNDTLSQLYVDGSIKSTVAESVSPSGSNDLNFGYTTGGSYGSGALDEVRIYNRVLTPAEVKLLYNLGR